MMQQNQQLKLARFIFVKHFIESINVAPNRKEDLFKVLAYIKMRALE